MIYLIMAAVVAAAAAGISILIVLKMQKDKRKSIQRANEVMNRETAAVPIGTNVVFYKNRTGTIFGFTIWGFPGYDHRGTDIVSAAVTVLTYNGLNSIKAYTRDKVKWEERDGYAKCLLPDLVNNRGSREAKVLLNSMASGMEDITVRYRGYLRVRYVEVDGE